MCNSSANSLLEIFLFLILLSEVFLTKNLETIEASERWYPSYFGSLAISNTLLCNTLSAYAILFNCLKP